MRQVALEYAVGQISRQDLRVNYKYIHTNNRGYRIQIYSMATDYVHSLKYDSTYLVVSV